MTNRATGPSRLRRAIDSAAAILAGAGIDSARTDAELLAAHVVGVERGRLVTIDPPGPDFYEHYDQVIARRSQRVPLQHLTGTAAFGSVQLRVGPGVFIPRPETEALLEWALANLFQLGRSSWTCVPARVRWRSRWPRPGRTPG